MAMGDAVSLYATNTGKKVVTELAVKRGTGVKLEANFNVSGGSGFTKSYTAHFGSYQNGIGVLISGITIFDLTAGAKLMSYNIKDNVSGQLLIPITLTPAEQIEFPDGGILYIAQLAIDAYTTF